jgi:catechol 2,3-dioxygenase
VSALALPGDAHLTRLSLRVRDIDTSVAFYTDVLGLLVVERDAERTTLAPPERLFHLDLLHDPDATPRPYPCPGLYHFALVVPDRPALGSIFQRLIELRHPFEGMADHLVSEALYIRDPEMNGIELYRDRPKDEWPHDADGNLHMASDPIDADGILASAEAAGVLDPATRFGHIHLHVRDLEDAQAFFGDQLVLNRMAAMTGALFFAAGDYHHHVGANTWAPNRPVPESSTGLLSYTFGVPSGTDRKTVIDPVGAEVLFERG